MIEASLQLVRPNFVLELDLRLPAYGISALFGPSGCGKTTTLRCLAGLTRAPNSRIAINGQVWQDDAIGVFTPAHQRSIGVVFQDTVLFEHLNVRRNIEFGWRRLKPVQRRISLDDAVALTGVEALMERMTAQLSGGERQRVALARALAVSPHLLLMDEPLAALDATRKAEILPALERLNTAMGIPIIYVSHALDEIAHLADHLVIMAQGRAVATGSAAELLTRMDLPRAITEEPGVVLQGMVALRDSTWQLARLDVAGTALWARDPGLALGHPIKLKVLARDVSLNLLPQTGSSILNQLSAIIESVTADTHPAYSLVQIRITPRSEATEGMRLVARVTRQSVHTLNLVPGKTVWAMVQSLALLD